MEYIQLKFSIFSFTILKIISPYFTFYTIFVDHKLCILD